LRKPIGVSIESLFTLLDSLGDWELLNESLFIMYLSVINPKIRDSVSVHDTLGNKMEEPIGYKHFKQKIRGNRSSLS